MTLTHDHSSTEPSSVQLSPEVLRIITASNPNVLLTGTEEATGAFVHALMPHLRRPVESPSGDGLPVPNYAPGTLILRELETLDLEHQRQLLGWLDGPGEGAQLISLATESLYPLVEKGQFLDTLFYRLNTVHLEATL